MENSQSDVVQLTRLPGFGPKKVTRMDHVFEQPFHMGTAGDALPAATVSSASASAPVTAATSVPAVAARPSGSRGDRGSACGRMGVDVIWDIELDVNSPSPEPAPVRGDAPSRRVCEEQESPPWDTSNGHWLVRGWKGKGKWNSIPTALPRLYRVAWIVLERIETFVGHI